MATPSSLMKSSPVCRTIQINGKQHYRWRAVDQESLPHERSECFGYGEVVDVYLQAKRDAAVSNLLNLGSHLAMAQHYRNLRTGALDEWSRAVV